MTIAGSTSPFLDSELVIALVAPVGTNLDRFQERLEAQLKRVGYRVRPIRLSALVRNYAYEPDAKADPRRGKHAARIHEAMHAGNALRLASGMGEFLALAAAADIHAARDQNDPVLPKTAHLLRSLKHPDEVRALRRIYGSAFFLLGVTVKEQQRRDYLQNVLDCSPAEIDTLLRRDEHEEDDRFISPEGFNFGQRTRDTFELADAFIPLDSESDLRRFIELVFSFPYHTPRADEYAMFLAFAASLRSADLSRQVGAVIRSAAGDVVAVGANDVPRAGGGLYWPGDDDSRDWIRGFDSNEQQRTRIIANTLRRACPGEHDDGWWEKARRSLIGAPINDITEFGRATHAEMEAMLSCARSGISTRGATLYSTTFPCHNCAKHIIAAGLSRVVYVEPYPKSLATALFGDSISLEPATTDGLVHFEPFVGVGPRRFLDLFSIALSSGTKLARKRGGQTVSWTPDQAVVRSPCLPNSYIQRERAAWNEIGTQSSNPEGPP